MRKPKFIDLFGGAGGMSLGFKMAGMAPAGALDIFDAGIDTYRANFPEVPEGSVVCADAEKNDIIEKFTDATYLKPDGVDVIIGGPPCQGFSTVGRVVRASRVRNGHGNGSSGDARFIDDKRNHLYKAFVEFVKHFEPRAIVMENVTGMISYKNRTVVKQISKDFVDAGYPNTEWKVLNAANFGATDPAADLLHGNQGGYRNHLA